MSLTPNDIRNYEFSIQMRGYDRQDVENFMEQVARAMEQLKQENLKLSMEIESLNTQLTGLKQFEETIKNAAIDARRNADMTIGSAKKEAGIILENARKDAEQILGTRAERANELEVQLTKLELARKSYLTKLKNLIQSHLEIVDEVVTAEAPAEIKEVVEKRKADVKPVTPTAAPSGESRTQPVRQQQPAAAPQQSSEQTQPVPQHQPQPTAQDDTPDIMGDNERVEVTDSSEYESNMRETVGTPAPQETLKTEESNEAGDIIPAELKKKLSENVDPELLAALDNYAKIGPKQGEDNERPGNIVAHRDPGEDDEEAETDATGKVATQEDDTAGYDHNTIDPDVPVGEETPAEGANVPSEDNELADALDKVAQKFEEEMDKAARQ